MSDLSGFFFFCSFFLLISILNFAYPLLLFLYLFSYFSFFFAFALLEIGDKVHICPRFITECQIYFMIFFFQSIGAGL